MQLNAEPCPRRKNFWGNGRGKANIEVARYLLSARQVQTAGRA